MNAAAEPVAVAGANGHAIRVELLGPVIAHRAPSMLRYGDELQDALAGEPGIEVTRELVPDAAPRVRQQSKLSLAVRRVRELGTPLLPPPRRSGASQADLFHIIDSVDAHLLRGFPRERTLITCHDVFALLDQAEPQGAGVRGRVERWRRGTWRDQLSTAGHIVCVSETTRADVLRTLDIDEARVSVVANGVRPIFHRLPAKAVQAVRSQLPGTYLMMHVASGWQPRKNFEGTIRVLQELRNRQLDVKLVRAGVPLPASAAAEADRLGMSAHIIERGRVSDQELVELYNASDVFLFPSFYEGFGWPPVEAMACGTPVVTSTAPALTELIADAGIAAPAADVPALAGAVASVLTDRTRRDQLIERGLDRAAQFSWQRTAQDLGALYRQRLTALNGSTSASALGHD